MRFHFRVAVAVAALVGGGAVVGAPGPTIAAATGTFQAFENPGGGSIITGALGQQASLRSATAAMLRRIHARLGARPVVEQVAQNPTEHSIALFFTASRNGRPYTGMSVITAVPGAPASGAALYDTTARFPTTIGPMLRRLQTNTSPVTQRGSVTPAAPPHALIAHAFSDGTGSISIPADWTLRLAGGGSATAVGPTGEIVCYNVASGALDPTNPMGRNYFRRLPPQLQQTQMQRMAILPYSDDPVRAWTTMFSQVARQNGKSGPAFTVKSSKQMGSRSAEITGTGTNRVPITFVAFVQLSPPNTMGQWSMFSTYVVVPTAQVAQQGATAAAVLESVHINFQAVAAQGAAIRQMFKQQFDAMIANGEAQNNARQARTDQFLANDRAAQEGMHKQAVAMENFSLDRTTIINTQTGAHGTVGNGFADALVQSNTKYQKVPANQLLRGVDY